MDPEQIKQEIAALYSQGKSHDEIIATLKAKYAKPAAPAQSAPASNMPAGPYGLPSSGKPPGEILQAAGKSAAKVLPTGEDFVASAVGGLTPPMAGPGIQRPIEEVARQAYRGQPIDVGQALATGEKKATIDTLGNMAGLAVGGIASAPGAIKSFFVGNVPRLEALRAFFDKAVAAAAGNEAAVSTRATAAYRAHTTELAKEVDKVTGPMFDTARQSAGDTIVPVNNFLAKAKTLVAESASPLSGEVSPEVRKLATIVNKVDQTGGVTVTELQNGMKVWGRAARDPTNKESQRIGTQLVNGLRDDLGVVADAMAQDPQLANAGKALQDARSAFAEGEQIKREAKSKLLSQAFDQEVKNDSPDWLARNVIGSASPAKIARAVKVLDAADPAILPELRATSMRNFAAKAPSAEGQGLINPSTFSGMWDKNADKIRALYGNDQAGYAKLAEVASVARRMSSLAGRGKDTMMWWAGTTAVNLQSLKGQLNQVLGERSLYKIINDPEGRDLFLKLVQSKWALKPQIAGNLVAKLVEIGQSSPQENQ